MSNLISGKDELKESIEFKEIFDKNFIICDWQAIDLVNSVVASHKLKGNMLWVRLMAPSGFGKTDILRSYSDNEKYCAKLESITVSAIKRGYVPESGAKLPTMLERLNGKLAITKEFSVMLTTKHETREEIYGLLRSVHDGELISDYGGEAGYLPQKSSFDWLIGTTNYAERFNDLEQQLGTRFLDVKLKLPEDQKSIVIKAMSNDGKLDDIYKRVAEKADALITAIKPNETAYSIDMNWIASVCIVIAKLRTPAYRNPYKKNELELGQTESPSRLGQYICKMVKGLGLLGITNYKPYVIRLMYDNIKTSRAKVIEILVKYGEQVKQETIEGEAGISQSTVHYAQEELRLLDFDLKTLVELERDAYSHE